MANQRARKEILRFILNVVNSNPEKEFSKKSLIAEIMFSEGVRKITAEDYVNTLVNAGLVSLDGDILKAIPK